jgi:hypothetical protein
MMIGVVVPCFRQERHLPRTLAAIERALEGREWRGALVLASPDHAPLPPLSSRWQTIAPPVSRPLTPGAARNLGLAALPADWLLFVDADLEVDAVWVDEALRVAEREPGLGGLWGRVEEWFTDDRVERLGARDMFHVGPEERRVDYVTTPALYRRGALLAAGGYDPRLNSEEDFELGLRFARVPLELRSLGRLSGRHWSAPRPSFVELARRWRSGLCFGQGQVLRLYFGRPGFGRLLRRQALYLGALALWAAGLAALLAAFALRRPGALLAWALLPLAVLALMAARKRSFALALHSLLSWSLLGLGLLVGLFRLPAERETRRVAGGRP